VLLTLEGSAKVIDELANAAAERVDDGLRSSDLYEATSNCTTLPRREASAMTTDRAWQHGHFVFRTTQTYG
jgi:hypothetical protein